MWIRSPQELKRCKYPRVRLTKMDTGLRRRGGGDGGGSVEERPVEVATKLVRKFDMYAKPKEEYRDTAGSRRSLTVGAWALVALLALYETWAFATSSTTKEHMLVDTTLGQKLRINVNITFPALSCAELHVDAMVRTSPLSPSFPAHAAVTPPFLSPVPPRSLPHHAPFSLFPTIYNSLFFFPLSLSLFLLQDVAGDYHPYMEQNMAKQRLKADGRPIGRTVAEQANVYENKGFELPAGYCGSCYGAEEKEGDCCNTCDEVVARYSVKGWATKEIRRDSEQCKRDSSNPLAGVQDGEGCVLMTPPPPSLSPLLP